MCYELNKYLLGLSKEEDCLTKSSYKYWIFFKHMLKSKRCHKSKYKYIDKYYSLSITIVNQNLY